MWVPYLALGPLKVEGDEEAARASFGDRTQRPFLIAYLLDSPFRRELESDFALNSERELFLVDADGCRLPARLCPGRNGRLAEILLSLEARSAEEALARSWRAVSAACSRWTVASGRGVAVAGFRIADLRHRARWRVVPFQPSTVPLPELPATALRPPHRLLLRAYEEARRGRSAVLRLLACWRVLTAFLEGREPFATTDRLAAARGLARSALEVSRLDLVLADCRALFGEPTPLALARVRDWLRPHVARARSLFEPEGPIEEAEAWFAFEAERELISAANLLDLIAHRLLAEELRLLAALAAPEASPLARTHPEHATQS